MAEIKLLSVSLRDVISKPMLLDAALAACYVCKEEYMVRIDGLTTDDLEAFEKSEVLNWLPKDRKCGAYTIGYKYGWLYSVDDKVGRSVHSCSYSLESLKNDIQEYDMNKHHICLWPSGII